MSVHTNDYIAKFDVVRHFPHSELVPCSERSQVFGRSGGAPQDAHFALELARGSAEGSLPSVSPSLPWWPGGLNFDFVERVSPPGDSRVHWRVHGLICRLDDARSGDSQSVHDSATLDGVLTHTKEECSTTKGGGGGHRKGEG